VKLGNFAGLIALTAFAAGLAGFGFRIWQDQASPTAQSISDQASSYPRPGSLAANLGAPRPSFSLPDLQGKRHDIAQWDGNVLLINFWATWCPPCRREIPDFIAVQEKYGEAGFHTIGVAIDDPEQVRDYARAMGINYPLLHGQQDAIAITRQYGNRATALPYSVLVDRKGIIRHIHNQGELRKRELEQLVQPLL
jgi:peroxiredoxin